MKKLLSIVAFSVLTVSAFGQYAPVYQATPITGVPTSPAASTNLATPVVLDVRRQQNVAFQVTQSSVDAGQTNTYVFCRSLDGTLLDTNNVINVTVLSPGGGARTTVTNLSVAGTGYLVLRSITVFGTGGVTNTNPKWAIKTLSP
jgi:hypothetical protein